MKSDYIKYPANAIAVGSVGENKGKLLLACGCLDRIIVLDPDTGKVIREYGLEYGTGGALDDVRQGPDGTLNSGSRRGSHRRAGFTSRICAKRVSAKLQISARQDRDR